MNNQEQAKAAFPDGEFTRQDAQLLIAAYPALRIENDQGTHFMLVLRDGEGSLIWRCWNFQPAAGAGIKPYL